MENYMEKLRVIRYMYNFYYCIVYRALNQKQTLFLYSEKYYFSTFDRDTSVSFNLKKNLAECT